MRARWAVVASLALAGRAHAQPLSVTSTTYTGWHADNGNTTPYDDRYADALERIDASATRGPWTFALRLDAVGFAHAPIAAPGDTAALDNRYRDDIRPERISVGWVDRDVEITAGDSYVAFGRGLGLSLRKLDGLDVDTALRGAKLLVHRGSTEATLAVGYVNINNFDQASGRYADDPYDLVAGGQTKLQLGPVNAGVHGEAIAFHDALGFVPPGAAMPHYRDVVGLAGPMIDAPHLTDELGVYAEAVMQQREDGRGYGAYATSTWLVGSLAILVEAKAYGDLAEIQPHWPASEFQAVRYTAPPPVERMLEPLEHPQREIVGGRTRMDIRLSPGWLVYASYGAFRDYVGYVTAVSAMAPPVTVPGTIHDPYGGLETKWDEARSHASLSAGWRVVIADDSGELARGNLHAELDVVQAVTRTLSLQLHGNDLERHKRVPPFLDQRWREGSLQLGLHVASRLSVGAAWDYTTEPGQPHVHYPSATLAVRPSGKASVELFAGSQRGGLKCVSGVCRMFPPFEGAKLLVTLRY